LEFAITGMTAQELIAWRADSSKPNMGLTNWKSWPSGKILKTDVSIAKNYLSEKEIRELEKIVNMYLDYAELQASKGVTMKMSDWIWKLDAFLEFNEYEILTNLGKVSVDIAKRLAEGEYEKFRVIQDHEYISDFDKSIKSITHKK
jgi:hypothetical protein